jgi:hypothetical protein
MSVCVCMCVCLQLLAAGWKGRVPYVACIPAHLLVEGVRHRSSGTSSLGRALPSVAFLTFALTLEVALVRPNMAQANTLAAPDPREELVVSPTYAAHEHPLVAIRVSPHL